MGNVVHSIRNFAVIGADVGEQRSVRDMLVPDSVESLPHDGISGSIKITQTCLLRTLVLLVFLYNSETWTIFKQDLNKNDVSQMGCHRQILGVPLSSTKSQATTHENNVNSSQALKTNSGSAVCIGLAMSAE